MSTLQSLKEAQEQVPSSSKTGDINCPSLAISKGALKEAQESGKHD
jgi:hypothetical protein